MRAWRVLTVAVIAAASLQVCGGDDSSERPPTDVQWVAGFCAAALRLGEATASIAPAPHGEAVTSETLKAMAPAYRQFGDDLDRLGAPEGLEEYHRQFADAARESAALMAKGDLTKDPFRPLEQVAEPPGMKERFAGLAAADQACQRAGVTFSEDSGVATVTPPAGSFLPPTTDYSHPSAFLASGPQSTLSERSIKVLRDEVLSARIPGAKGIYRWMARTFTTRASGGASIGATDVNGLIESRTLTGCHDWALVMTAALRYFGYPALMVDTAGLQWAEDFSAGKVEAFAGHVFAEVLTNEGWMLVDCAAGRFTLDYDPRNPVIAYTGAGDGKGFYALFKGLDPASYGVTSSEALQQRMREFARALPGLPITLPDYRWQDFD